MRLLVSLLAGLLLLGAGSAFAHAEFVEGSPEKGSVVNEKPEQVTITFTEPVVTRFSIFKVYPLAVEVALSADNASLQLNGLAAALVNDVLMAKDGEDERADSGLVTAERQSAIVTLDLREELAPGHYVVMWRSLSADTHITQGFYVFTYQEAARP